MMQPNMHEDDMTCRQILDELVEQTWLLIRLWEDHLSELRGDKHNSRMYDAIVAALAQKKIVHGFHFSHDATVQAEYLWVWYL